MESTESRADSSGAGDALLGALADEYLRRLEAGERPDIDALVRSHPHLAGPLRGLLPLLGRALDRTPTPTPASPAVPARMGEYEIVRELGRGGMGVVYEAVQPALGRRVALKVVAPHGQRFTERFRREAKSTARLQHPNIVPVLEAGEQDGTAYYVMPLIAGRSLAGLPPLDPLPAALIGLQVAEALAYAHAQGVWHRDVKPGNILLDERGTAWVLDFGLCLVEGQTALTGTGDFLGTPRYAPPERFRGGDDRRGDQYGLGVTLYELLAGRPAFDADGKEELLRQVLEGTPPPLRSQRPDVPRDLATVVHKAMARDPAQRYATCTELADDLRRFLAGRPIRARPVGPLERAWRWCRRSPATAGLLAAVFVLLAVVAVGSVVGGAIARQRQQQAESAEAVAEARLWRSLLERARAARRSGRMGQRHDSLDAIGQAVEIARRRGATAEDLAALRDEAIACLPLPDVRPGPEVWGGPPHRAPATALDPSATLYAHRPPDAPDRIDVRRVGTHERLASLRRPEQVRGRDALPQLGPGGRYLSADYRGERRSAVWCVATGGLIRVSGVQRPGQTEARGPFVAFAPDRDEAAIADADCVRVVDLASRKELRVLAQPGPVAALAYSPDGRELAIWPEGSAKIAFYTAGGPAPSRRLTVLGSITHALAWHPHGNFLATSDAGLTISLWSADTHFRVGGISSPTGATTLAFHPGGQYLASLGFDGSTRVWNVWEAREVLRLPYLNPCPYFSGDGRVFGFEPDGRDAGRLLEFTASDELRTIGPAHNTNWGGMTPDGRLVFDFRFSLDVWDRRSGRLLAALPFSAEQYHYRSLATANGSLLAVGPGSRGVAIPYTVSRDNTARFGPPRPMALIGTPDVRTQTPTPDGRVVCSSGMVYDPASGAALRVLGGFAEDPPAHFPEGRPAIAVSPDGRLVAHAGSSVTVHDTRTGATVARFPAEVPPRLAFTPDGRHLVTSTVTEFAFRDVRTWGVVATLPRKGGSLPGGMALSPGVWAFELEMGVLALVAPAVPASPRPPAPLARLAAPFDRMIAWAAFTPDGGGLVAHNHSAAVAAWDLRAVRGRLAELGLDWDAPPIPGEDTQPVTRAEVVGRDMLTDLGKLDAHWRALDEAAAARVGRGDAAASHRAMYRAQQAGRHEEALARAKEALAAAPDSLSAWEVMGWSLLQLGRNGEAAAAFRRCVELHPGSAPYRQALATARKGGG